MKRYLTFALVVALAACSPGDTSATTTSGSVDSSTSTVRSPSTTSTSTTITPATTILPATTTTLLEGNWAEEPLIVTSTWSGVLGWWDGSDWVEPENMSELGISEGLDFQAVGLEGPTRTTAASVAEVCDWFDSGNIRVEMVDHASMVVEVDGESYGSIGISAPWDLSPNPFQVLSDDGTHAGFARQVLEELGVLVEDPVVKQVISVDLEGDGVLEKLVVAEDYEIQFDPVESGYSVVFMRRLVDGEVHTTVVRSDVATPENVRLGTHAAIVAVADLSGDGTMEVVISSHSWEASGVSVNALEGDAITTVLGSGCGV